MKLIPSTPIPETLTFRWLSGGEAAQTEYLGKMYVGPELNQVPHRIVRVGEAAQETEEGFIEGWLFFELEGGTVVGREDPAVKSRSYEII